MYVTTHISIEYEAESVHVRSLHNTETSISSRVLKTT